MQLRAAQARYPDIKEDAAWTLLIRQTIQQMLGRRIRRNVVAGFLQTTFDGRPEGRIIIDDMNNTRQEASPVIETTAKENEGHSGRPGLAQQRTT